MDTRRLRAFVTVSELGGISAAATRLGYAQSTLSTQLRSLEDELGAALLRRTSTGVELTEAGDRLLPIAREVLDLDERARRAVRGQRPRVRIGALETLAEEWLPDILAALDCGGGGPGTAADVELTVGSRGRLDAGLAAGALDVVFLFDNGVASAGPSAVVGADRVVLVAGPGHPLTAAGQVGVETLMETGFVIAEAGCTTHMLVDRHGRDLAGRTPISMITGSLAALRRMVTLGRGVALLPYMTALRLLDSGELVRLPVAGGLPEVTIEARWRPVRRGADSAGGTVEALVRLARRHRPPQPELERTA